MLLHQFAGLKKNKSIPLLYEFIFYCFVRLKDTLNELGLIWTSDVFSERKKKSIEK